MERAFASGLLLICEGSCFLHGLECHGTVVFLLELAKTPDDFEARSKVLIHGFHLQV
jgi:C4-dicarboxylate transporter